MPHGAVGQWQRGFELGRAAADAQHKHCVCRWWPCTASINGNRHIRAKSDAWQEIIMAYTIQYCDWNQSRQQPLRDICVLNGFVNSSGLLLWQTQLVVLYIVFAPNGHSAPDIQFQSH